MFLSMMSFLGGGRSCMYVEFRFPLFCVDCCVSFHSGFKFSQLEMSRYFSNLSFLVYVRL